MDKYDMYNKIFSGCVDDNDADFIKYLCPEEDKEIINLIINSRDKTTEIGFCKMEKIINDLFCIAGREDCEKYIEDLKRNKITNNLNNIMHKYNNNDVFTDCQKKIIDRIISGKLEMCIHIEIPKIKEPCPHCGNINSIPVGTTYVVCGVDAEGLIPIESYENCCFNDWCFGCKKILCKNWYKDELYNEENRSHNEICCRIHAKNNTYNYPSDYCQCKRRKSIIVI